MRVYPRAARASGRMARHGKPQGRSCTGLVAVPVQAAAVLGPSVAGLVVEATGTQRTLFGVAAVAVGVAWSPTRWRILTRPREDSCPWQ